MKKRILTMDDLVKFCSDNNLQNFSSSESGYQLFVQIPSVYESDNENTTDSILYGKVKLMHTGLNRNKSNVTKQAAENCLSTIQYKPVLANFTDVNGELDFTSHDMEIDDEGNVNYLERQVGCFTSDKPYMEYEKETDRYYVYATVAIPREYTKAADVIESKNGTKVSAELCVNSMSYDVKNNELLLDDIEVMGVTLLGTNPETGMEVQEGMEGARLDIKDFSQSVQFEKDNKLIETLERLNTTLSRFDIDTTTRKEDTQVEDTNIEMLEEEIVVDEETTLMEDSTTEEEVVAEPETESQEEETTPVEETPEVVEEDETVSEDVAADFEEEVDDDKVVYSLSVGESKKDFAVSLGDKQFAIETLVNETYGESDNDYFMVDVYEEDKNVVMHGLFSGKHFRQTFACKKKKYSLTGDRIPVFAQYLTEDEIASLDFMKSNYAEISDKLAKYEAEPEKVEILSSAEYASIADKEEFIELQKVETHFDMSIDEIKAKADNIIVEYAKKGALTFASSEDDKKSVGKIGLPRKEKFTKRGRYGGLVKKEDK